MSLGEISELYLAALLQLAAIVLLLAASWRLAAWLWPAPDWGERLLAVGLVFCSLAVVLVISLGLTGLLYPALVGGVVVALWALVHWRVPAGEPLPSLLKVDCPREVLLLLLLAALVALPFLLRALLWVPLTWDDLTYHLFYPAVWIREGRVFLIDGVYPYNYLAYYPKNHELIDTFLMVIVRNDAFVKLLNLPLAGLTAVAAGLLCVQLGGSRLAGWCVALFVLTIPAMFCWAATSYVEPLLNCAILAAVYFVVRAFRAPLVKLWRCGLLAGLALGLAVGTKYTALYLVVLLVPIVLAVPLVRQLRLRAVLGFPALFAAAFLATGIWWYACNAAVTGNPVYPVPLGPLNAVVDPDRPRIDESSIWTDFPRLYASGKLTKAWLGDFNLLGVWFGEEPSREVLQRTDAPGAMGLGPKVFLILPLLVLGLLLAPEWRRGRFHFDAATLCAVMVTLVAALLLLYTYLRVPLFGEDVVLKCQVRFAVPFVLLAVVLAFAALGRSPFDAVLPLLTFAGLVVDALTLDLRWPGLDPRQSLVLLATLGACLWMVRKVPLATVSPRVACRLAGLVLLVGLYFLLVHREFYRYHQWNECSEVHGGYGPAFAEAAYRLDHEFPGATVAYVGDFASYLYMFVGPRFERPVCYVSTHEGPALSYLKHGALRDQFDQAAWEKNLKDSGASVLIAFRFQDRQLAASYYWSEETYWADALQFPLLFENDYCRIYQVVFPPHAGYTGQTAAKKGHAGDVGLRRYRSYHRHGTHAGRHRGTDRPGLFADHGVAHGEHVREPPLRPAGRYDEGARWRSR